MGSTAMENPWHPDVTRIYLWCSQGSIKLKNGILPTPSHNMSQGSCPMLIINCLCSVTNTKCKLDIICHSLQMFWHCRFQKLLLSLTNWFFIHMSIICDNISLQKMLGCIYCLHLSLLPLEKNIWGKHYIVKLATGPSMGRGLFADEDITVPPGGYEVLFPYFGPFCSYMAWHMLVNVSLEWKLCGLVVILFEVYKKHNDPNQLPYCDGDRALQENQPSVTRFYDYNRA
jgi:hypothetical protein